LKNREEKMKLLFKGIIFIILFSALSAAQFRYYLPNQSFNKKKGINGVEFILGGAVQYSLPVSPIGQDSFSNSYKEAVSGKLSVGFPVSDGLDLFVSAGYSAFYNKYFNGNIMFIPLLAEFRYDMLKLEEGSSMYVSGGGGFSINKLTSATFNPTWVNLAFTIGAGINMKLEKGVVLYAGPVLNGYFGRNFSEDVLMTLSLQSGVNFSF